MVGKNWYYELIKDALSLRKFIPFHQFQCFHFFAKLKGLKEREYFTTDRVYIIDGTGISTVYNPNNKSHKRNETIRTHDVKERDINVFPRVFFKEHILKGAPSGNIGFAHPSG